MNSESVGFAEVLNSLDVLSPLRDDLLSRYYVDRPGNPFPEMLVSLRASASDTKILFSGSRGSGKTTELIRLSEALQDQYFVVFFDTAVSVDPSKVDYVQLLFGLTLQVYKSAAEQRVKLRQRVAEDLYDLVTIATVAEEKKRNRQVEVNAELNAQVAKLTGTLGLGSGRAKTITRQLEPRVAEIIEKFNNLIEEVTKKTKKRVLVIVDGLDRASPQVQTDLFLRYGEALYSPKCHIVYVVAPSLLYERNTSAIKYAVSAHYRLPNFQVVKRSGRSDTTGRRLLREIVERRVGDGLFSKSALDDIVIHSGGIVRELLWLAREALVRAEHEGSNQVNLGHAREAIKRMRRNFSCMLRQDDLALLSTMVTTGIAPRTEITKSLIANQCILELEDGLGVWHIVHPILTAVVEQYLGKSKGVQ